MPVRFVQYQHPEAFQRAGRRAGYGFRVQEVNWVSTPVLPQDIIYTPTA